MDIALSLPVVVVVCGLSSTCIGPRHPTPHASQVSFFYVGGSSIAGKGASDAHVSHASAPVAPHTWRTPAWEGKDEEGRERRRKERNGSEPRRRTAVRHERHGQRAQRTCHATEEMRSTWRSETHACRREERWLMRKTHDRSIPRTTDQAGSGDPRNGGTTGERSFVSSHGQPAAEAAARWTRKRHAQHRSRSVHQRHAEPHEQSTVHASGGKTRKRNDAGASTCHVRNRFPTQRNTSDKDEDQEDEYNKERWTRHVARASLHATTSLRPMVVRRLADVD